VFVKEVLVVHSKTEMTFGGFDEGQEEPQSSAGGDEEEADDEGEQGGFRPKMRDAALGGTVRGGRVDRSWDESSKALYSRRLKELAPDKFLRGGVTIATAKGDSSEKDLRRQQVESGSPANANTVQFGRNK